MRSPKQRVLVGLLAILVVGSGCPTRPTGTRGPADERGTLAAWTPALRQTWDARRATARWLRDYLAAALLAAREAQRRKLPEAEQDTAVERLGPGRWRIHFGTTATPGALQVRHRAQVTRGTGRQVAWETLPRPTPLAPRLAALLRAEQHAQRWMESRRPGWRKRLEQQHQVLYTSFSRRLASGDIEVWLIPFSKADEAVVLGGDYRIRTSANGEKVVAFRSLHRGLVRVRRPAGRAPRTVVLNHVHGATEGDLPAASDLLKIATSPHLHGLAVIGPRYTVLTGLDNGAKGWLGRLYHSRGFRRLLR